MTEITPVNGIGGVLTLAPARGASPAGSQGTETMDDQLEISDVGLALSSLDGSADIRVDKVASIREEIANGTFETDERIRGTALRLLDVLRQGD
jgi:anti-sigma28 factor (negative regulator of flagellin synthesis)